MLNTEEVYLDPESYLNTVQFGDNLEPRCACLLMLDTSSSMEGPSIKQLNNGYEDLVESLQGDDLSSLRVELAVMTFGGTPNVVQDFKTVDQIDPGVFTASGGTPMGEAIAQGIAMIEERKKVYRDNGIPYFRPWVFLITDGEPTDKWKDAAAMVKKHEEEKGLIFFAVGVDKADMSVLKQISVREPRRLKQGQFEEMFLWLSRSLSAVANSEPEDKVGLLPADGWGTISV